MVSSAEVLPELQQRGWQSGEMAEVPRVLQEHFWATELRSKPPGEEQTGTLLLAWLTILGIDWYCFGGAPSSPHRLVHEHGALHLTQVPSALSLGEECWTKAY